MRKKIETQLHLKDATLAIDLLCSLGNCNGRIAGALIIEHLFGVYSEQAIAQQRGCALGAIWQVHYIYHNRKHFRHR